MPASTVTQVKVGPYTVAASDDGSGPALLYLHSFEGPIDDRFVTFGGGRRLVRPTHPGFAGTEIDRALQDIHNVALLYDGLLSALAIDRADVVGHSLGAMFAAELAAVAPQRVRSLTLVAPIGVWSDDHPAPDILSAGGSYLTRLLWADPAHPAAQGTLSPLDRTANLAIAGHYMWPLPDRGLRDRAYRLTMPVHLVRGDSDAFVGESQLSDWRALLPTATVHTVEAAGHFPMVEQPDRFASLVNEILG